MPNAAWMLVTQARQATPIFVMPSADCMSAGADAYLADAQGAAWDSLVLAAQGPSQEPSQSLAQAVADALAQLPAPVFDEEAAAQIDCRLSHEPHDAFFRIARGTEAAALAPMSLARATLGALQVFADETPDASERRDYAGLHTALLQVLAEVLNRAGPLAAIEAAPLPQMRAPEPLRRWVRGHQIFAVLTQGLIRQLHRVVRAVEAEAEPAREAEANAVLTLELDRMAALYRASAQAFRFTADFDPAIYSQTIRPSMCEPYTPKGFSGTLSSDHGELVKLLVGKREPLALASQRCPQAYEAMRGAIASVYDDHKKVCARFDGDRGPSLRSASVKGDQTAVDMLDKFRTRRIAMLP